MMTYLSILTAIALLWISSRYYLIPNGPLRRVRIVFFAYMSVYVMIMGSGHEYIRDDFYHIVVFAGAGGVFAILIYFGALLERQLHKVRKYAKRSGTIFNLIGMRLSTSLNILWINPEYCEKLLGYTSEQLIGKPLEVLVHKDSEEGIMALRDYVQNHRHTNPLSIKLELVHKDYSRHWFLMAVQKEVSDGQLVTLWAGLQNITTDVHQQEFLGLLKQTLDAATIGITVVDDDTKTILYVNRYEAKMHGFEAHELVGEDARTLAPDIMKGVIVRGETPLKSYVSLNLHRNGGVFPVRLNKASITYGTGKSARHARVMFCQQLTELTPYEAMTLGDRTLLLLIVQTTGTIYWMNDVFQELLGLLESRELPENIRAIFDRESAEVLMHGHTQESGHEIPQKYVVFDADGRPHEILLAMFFGASHIFLIGQEVSMRSQKTGIE